MAKKQKAGKGQDTTESVTFGNRLNVPDEPEPEETESGDDELEPDEELEDGGDEEGDEDLEGDPDDEGDDEAPEETEDADEEEGEEADEESSEDESDEADGDDDAGPKKKKAKAEESQEGEGEDRNVPLQALIAERKKAKERIAALEAENAKLKGEQGGDVSGEGDAAAASAAAKELVSQLDSKIAAQSFRGARRAYKDFDEKAQAVREHAAKVDPKVLDMIDADEDPGEATYFFGSQILFQKKYGKSPAEQVENIRKEVTAELTKQIREEVQKEFREKLLKKKKQPTNISTSRAAGGSDAKAYTSLSFGKRLTARR